MAKETLGAHLRNLLTPYKLLLDLYDNGIKLEGDHKDKFIKTLNNNLKDLIDFSNSKQMENNLWKD